MIKSITVVSCVFPPEPIVSSRTSIQIVNELAHRSNDVTVLASFPNRPGGKIFPGYQRQLFLRDPNQTDFDLTRCWNTLSARSSLITRLLENFSFGITSSFRLLFSPRPGVIYANTWPVLAQGLTCLAARLRHIPIVLSIQDIYPESLSFQGRFSSRNILYRILRWIDRANARSAGALIVISEKFAQIYIQDRGIPPEKVHVIPNWVDPKEIELLPRVQFREKAGIPENAFVFGYGGNIGVAAGVENLIRAFSQVVDDRTYLLIAGDGSRRQVCQELVDQLKVKNVILHSPWPAEETSEVLAAADVLVLPTLGEQSLASVPSKMLNYMLAARPMVAFVLANSDTARLIREIGCGWTVDPDDCDHIVQELSRIRDISARFLEEKGSAGREYVLRNLSSDICVPRVIDILERLANEG